MSETKCILIVCYLLLSVVLQAHGQVTDCCLVCRVYWKCVFSHQINRLYLRLASMHSPRQSMKCKWKRPNKWRAHARKSSKPPRMTWRSCRRSRSHRPRVENVCTRALWSRLVWYKRFPNPRPVNRFKGSSINKFHIFALKVGWWETIGWEVHRADRRNSTRK